MKLRCLSLADAEISVRAQVDSAVAALPPDFKPPAELRRGLVAYYVAEAAKEMAAAILSDADSTTPADIILLVQSEVERLIRDEVFKRANS